MADRDRLARRAADLQRMTQALVQALLWRELGDEEWGRLQADPAAWCATLTAPEARRLMISTAMDVRE